MATPHLNCQRPKRRRSNQAPRRPPITCALPRWRFARVFGRNPLVRASDRVGALVVALAVVMALVAVPIAVAKGAAVYDSRSRLYAEQAQNSHVVTAIVTDHKVIHRESLGPAVTVLARWFAAGTQHTGAVSAPPGVKTGNSIDIWVNEDGSHVGPPPKTAYDEAVAYASLTWLSAAIVAATLVVGTRAVLNRVRHAAGPTLHLREGRCGHAPECRVEHTRQGPGRPRNTACTNSFQVFIPCRPHDPAAVVSVSAARVPLGGPGGWFGPSSRRLPWAVYRSRHLTDIIY